MQIPRYQQQTELSPLPNARVQAPTDANAYGAGVGRGMQQVGDVEFKVAKEQQEKRDAIGIIDADNKLNSAMTGVLFNQDTGIMHRNSTKAEGISKEFETTWQKNYGEILGGLNERQKVVFMQRANTHKYSWYQMVNNHETTQREVALKENTNASVSLAATKLSQSGMWMNPELVKTELGVVDRNIDFTFKDSDPAVAQAEKAKARNIIFNNLLETRKNSGDYVSIKKIEELYGDQINPSILSGFTGWAKDKETGVEIISESKKILEENGWDLDAALKDPRVKKSTTKSTGNQSWEQTKELVAGNESSGWADPYKAHNDDSGAHGKYQFMPRTWQGVMGDAPMTPENQEKAFDLKYKRIFDKYGAGGVLVAVYAGDQNAERWAKGLPLIGDNGQEYSADAPQYYNGNRYPSVNEYVHNALGNDVTTTQDVEYNQRLEQQMRADYRDYEQLKGIRRHEQLINLKNALATATSINQQIAIVENSDLELYEKVDLKKKITDDYQTELSKSAQGALEILSASDKLTVSAVEAAKGQLSFMDYITWMAKATKQQKTEAEKLNDENDKQWHSWVINGLYPGNVAKQNEFILDLKATLDSEGKNGGDRTVRARELIDTEKKSANYILGYRSRNATEFNKIDETYPVSPGKSSISSLILKADPNADATAWMNILSYIGSAVQSGDPDATYAYNLIVDNGLPFTEEAFWNIRNEHARSNGRL